jgi:ketosteroid isomerase-like protein
MAHRSRSGDTARVMSQENVEAIGRAIAAVNARDIDGYLALCTDDIELRTPLVDVTGPYEGPEGIRRFFRDIEDAGPNFHMQLEHVEPVGEDRAVAFLKTHASGRSSGIPLDLETTNVYDLADGKIRRVRIFSDRQQALEAAGLSE